jgi:hypothetical protein
MKKTIVYFLCFLSILVIAYMVSIQKTESQAVPIVVEIPLAERSTMEQIDYYAELYDVDPNLMKSIIKCESKFKPNAKGDYKNGKYLANGLLQYHSESFIRHSKALGEELDYYSPLDQIKLGTFAISKGHGREWSSFRAIKNGGTYSFYSRLLERDYVVECPLSNFD